jgi:leucyl-tRNA synthetase
MKKTGHVKVDEPFAALFTQGMVCHESYKSDSGKWLFPEEVKKLEDGSVLEIATSIPVTVGRREVMSKSKKNVVPPATIIDTYGADTARLFMLSDSPPERDLEWSEAGVEGAWRYLNRVWRLVADNAATLPKPGGPVPNFSEKAAKSRSLVHKTIKAVSESLDHFRFNVAVAQIRTLTNALEELDAKDAGEAWVLREGLDALVKLMGPLTPHLAEELWITLGHKTMLCDEHWPKADVSLTVDDSVTIAVQVNGKLRATITLPRDAAEAQAKEAALAASNVAAAMGGKPPRKVIVVPNRIVNIVV